MNRTKKHQITMAAIFNPAEHFDFSKEEIRALSELAQETFLKSESFTAFHTIYPNIKMDKQVGFIGKASKAGVARQGCDPTSQSMTVGSRSTRMDSLRLGNSFR